MTAVTGLGSSYWLLSVVLATVVGCTLRFVAIGHQSFWYDEAFVDALVSRGSFADIFAGRARDNGNPPLHFLLDKLTAEYLGTDETSHRLLPAVFGTATIPLIGLLGRRLHSVEAGAVAAWLLALSPFQIEMSNEARVYSFLHLVTTLNALLFVRWVGSRSWLDGLAYAVGTAVACYAHYYIVFVVLGHLVVVLAQQERWRFLGRWCLLMAVAAMLWLPWAPAFIEQLTSPGNLSRLGGAWKAQFVATPVVFAVGRTFAWRDAGPGLLGLAALVSLIGFWIPAMIGLLRPLPNPRVSFPLLSAWVLLPILIPLAAALSGVPVYAHRYGSVGLAGFLIAVAIGLIRLPRYYRAGVAFVILAGTAYSLVNYYSHPLKDDWRSAAKAVLQDAPPGQVILTDSDIEVVPFLYYARQYDSIPPTVYGLHPQKGGDDLTAARYHNGSKQDSAPRDYTAEILTARCVTLGLCVPVRDEKAYRSLFERHGFRVTLVATFYRVTVIRFERIPGE